VATGPGADAATAPAVPAPIGQEAALEALRQLAAAGSARTLLFAGPDGVGRRVAARWYAALLNCAEGRRDPCGRCPSCRTFLPDEDGRIVSVDHREVAPPTSTREGRPARRRQIGIDLLVRREGGDPDPLQPWLLAPPRYRARVAVIDGADALTENAANAFLKTLEEPPSHAVIVLVAPGPDALLATVASRCTVVRFKPVEADPGDWDALHPHPALRLGRPGPLRRAATDPAVAAARAAVARLVEALDGDLGTAFAALEPLAEAWPPGGDLVPGMLREHARARSAAAYLSVDAALVEAERALAAYAHRGVTLKRLALALRAAWRAG
jgi:DNA polymerase III subunit delta'